MAQVEPLVDRAHDVAHGIVGDADVAADVVRGVFEMHRLWRDAFDRGPRLESILLATRAAALTHRTEHAEPAGAPRVPNASRNRVRLTEAAAVVLGADDTSTLELHLRHGIDAAALAGVLGVSAADAPRRLEQLRSRLDEALAAFILWRGGDPACPALADVLDDGTTLGPTPFDIVAFDRVVAHRATCATCDRLHQALVNPAGMLVAAPVVAVSPALRHRMLPTPAIGAATPAPELVGTHRRSTDDTPTALLWAPLDRPPRATTPVADVRPGAGRWPAIAAGAAAFLLVVAGGVAFALRAPADDDRPATTVGAGDLTGATDLTDATDLAVTDEVRSLGPPPPPVAGTTDLATSTSPPDTTGPQSTTPEGANTEPGDPGTSDAPLVVTTRPRAPQGPAPRVAVTTTAPSGPTTTEPDVDTGIPPLPPPPTSTTTTPTATTTTTPTTTAPTAPEPAAPGPTTAP